KGRRVSRRLAAQSVHRPPPRGGAAAQPRGAPRGLRAARPERGQPSGSGGRGPRGIRCNRPPPRALPRRAGRGRCRRAQLRRGGPTPRHQGGDNYLEGVPSPRPGGARDGVAPAKRPRRWVIVKMAHEDATPPTDEELSLAKKGEPLIAAAAADPRAPPSLRESIGRDRERAQAAPAESFWRRRWRMIAATA